MSDEDARALLLELAFGSEANAIVHEPVMACLAAFVGALFIVFATIFLALALLNWLV